VAGWPVENKDGIRHPIDSSHLGLFQISAARVEVVSAERSAMLVIFHRFAFQPAPEHRSCRLGVDQEFKEARNAFRARIRRALPAAPATAAESAPNYPPRIRTHGIQFHQSCWMVVGAAGFEPATS
jgi:hypothetical protein